ncbi:HNH endonuclease [Variovorax sp. GT1P44]|uniref:HNH endonuclease n=1 Tax=Variovorax sp. GT1P44 TaxID=3443742 RepID=UPI003F453768
MLSQSKSQPLVPAVRWGLTCLGGFPLSTFLLHRLAPVETDRRGHWPDGISPDVIDFVVQHCLCSDCNAPIKAPLAPCACGGPKDWDYEIAAVYPYEESRGLVDRLFARQKSRVGRARRALQASEVGGRVSRPEKAALFEAQGGICYYCADSLTDESGRACYHCDHFFPLAAGGRGDLENSVLACARCNLLKNNSDGHTFIRKLRKTSLVTEKTRLTQMRRSLAVWRRERGLKPFRSLVTIFDC